MVAILVAKNFERASGAPARNMDVAVTERGDTVHIADLVTDNVGFVSIYLEPGQYDWVGDNFRIPFDVLAPVTVAPAPPFVHTQDTPAATWIIPHNRGWKPPVTLIIAGEPVESNLEYPDLNTVVIELPEPMVGVAYIP